jgi:hypothetical protein
MRRFRHGDVLLKEVRILPPNVQRAAKKPLAVGEATGHSHRFEDGKYRFWTSGEKRFVEVLAPSSLVHEEHARLVIPPGVYEQLQEREYDYQVADDRPVYD